MPRTALVTSRSALIFAAMSLIAGCKLAVIVVEGGEVQSTASGACLAGTACLHEITDTNYTESFTASPSPGWHFSKWNTGGDFLCGDSTDPVCLVSNTGFGGINAVEALVASDKTFYIMPVFAKGPDTVTVEGKEWAQPDLFRGNTWDDINAICAGGPCAGTINGYDMTDWNWASYSEINTLFNHYLSNAGLSGGDLLGPEPEYVYESTGVTWGALFYVDGWRATIENEFGRATSGWTRDLPINDEGYVPEIAEYSDGLSQSAGTNYTYFRDQTLPALGGFFYRIP